MNIEANQQPIQAPFVPDAPSVQNVGTPVGADRSSGSSVMAGSIGVLVAGVFYLITWFVPWQPLHRYFLGHPVAIAATVLFSIACAVLASKWLRTRSQWCAFDSIRDEDLTLPSSHGSPADRWRDEHDVAHVASSWLDALAELPEAAHRSQLVGRLREVLFRQTQRGSSKLLADDLRELSNRDADDAHDSYGLVRIIAWAIPMLGFLGTVIGITQTLGGLDFTDGTGAVDRLKSGLYVAFDTTALGLVLSVITIFLQFPVESNEQRLLAAIDGRVGPLLSGGLPSDDAAEDQTELVVGLCDGIRAAVAESLASQTQLWRQTIDEANEHWQSVHQADANQFAVAIESTLAPALRDHVGTLDESLRFAGDRLERNAAEWQGTLESSFDRLLNGHEVVVTGQKQLAEFQQQLINRSDKLSEVHRQADTLQVVQATLDANLQRLTETNQSINNSIKASAGDGMADAMLVLARAVDVLSKRMADDDSSSTPSVRRAA